MLNIHVATATTLLETAVRSAGGNRLRMSANRRRVLEHMLTSDIPVTAYAILRRLRSTNPKAAPLSVYRALNFLISRRLIDRIEMLNAYVLRPELDASRPRQFLVCNNCRQIEEISDAVIEYNLRREAKMHNFQVERLIVEVSGICSTCAMGQIKQVD